MEMLCQELRPLLLSAQLIDCRSIEDSHFFLTFQKNGVIKRLDLCFAKPFVCFHLLQCSIASSSHPLQQWLQQATLEAIDIVPNDRILCLQFQQGQQILTLIGEFFSKHPNCYLVDQAGHIIFSLRPSNHTIYSYPPLRPFEKNLSIPLLTNAQMESVHFEKQKEFNFQKQKSRLLQHIQQKLKRTKKYYAQLQQDLQACQQWEKMQHEAELLKANFALIKKGLTTIAVWDWLTEKLVSLQLDPAQTAQVQIAARFKKSKKLQKGIAHVKEQLIHVQALMITLQNEIEKVENFSVLEEVAPLKHIKPRKETLKPTLPYREYESASGIKIWVGKNAKQNEKLTFTLAKGSDWWLHAHGFTGAHVILKAPKGKEPDQEALQDAMQLALHYSKAKDQAEICITQRKFVSRLGKGQIGKVQISKHKNVLIHTDESRLKDLRERLKTSKWLL
jgi:predicted ribosome quality control (RQC) complex YloA/Tae2 family protein